MNELEAIIEDTKLPIQLKDYFATSTTIKKYIDEAMLKDIEEFYIYYESVYHYDKSKCISQVKSEPLRNSILSHFN